MFFSIVATAVTSILSFFLGFFPPVNSTVVAQIESGLSDFKALIVGANWLFDVSSFLTLLSIVFVIESLYWVFKLIRYILSNISFGFIK